MWRFNRLRSTRMLFGTFRSWGERLKPSSPPGVPFVSPKGVSYFSLCLCLSCCCFLFSLIGDLPGASFCLFLLRRLLSLSLSSPPVAFLLLPLVFVPSAASAFFPDASSSCLCLLFLSVSVSSFCLSLSLYLSRLPVCLSVSVCLSL